MNNTKRIKYFKRIISKLEEYILSGEATEDEYIKIEGEIENMMDYVDMIQEPKSWDIKLNEKFTIKIFNNDTDKINIK